MGLNSLKSSFPSLPREALHVASKLREGTSESVFPLLTASAGSWHGSFPNLTSQILIFHSEVSSCDCIQLKVVIYHWGPHGFIFVAVVSSTSLSIKVNDMPYAFFLSTQNIYYRQEK